MQNTNMAAKLNWWVRRLSRRQIRPKGIEKAFRQWRVLGSVSQGTSTAPNGDDMVYRMNTTTLEIGQGIGGIKGGIVFAGMVGIVATGGLVLGGVSDMLSADYWRAANGLFDQFASYFLLPVFVLAGFPLFLVFTSLFLNAVFGYTDAPARFDRVRRKVWVFAGKREPMELDWDQLTPVVQSATPANVSVHTFHTLKLVDLDADGEVKVDGWHPRMVQIGPAFLDDQSVIAKYEFVRRFMEDGPQPCKNYLQHRRNLRELFNLAGCLDAVREADSSKGVGIYFVAFILFGVIGTTFFLFSVADYIASWTNRVPRWPQRLEAYAAQGGPMCPPPGAKPQRKSIVAKEVPFILLLLANLAGVVWLFLLVGRG